MSTDCKAMLESTSNHQPTISSPTCTALLCCPFCGFKDFDMMDTLYPDGVTWEYMDGDKCKRYGKHNEFKNKCWQIVCGCGAEMHEDSKAEVIERWNQRET